MDAKLMLVLIFTTVVAGYPSNRHTDNTARLSPAEAQTVLNYVSCGSCFHLRLPPRALYCVQYCVTSKECEYLLQQVILT